MAALPLLLGALVIAPLLTAQNSPVLPFRPLDAEYSGALDRIVMVSAGPNQLHIYNPATSSDTPVGLPAVPISLSVSPDGLYAAVGHNNLISYVNLSTATLQKTLPVALNVTNLVLAADYIYILPNMSVQISTGLIANALSSSQTVFPGRLNQAENAIYSAEGQLFRRTVSGSTVGAPTRNSSNNYCFAADMHILTDRVYSFCTRALETGGGLRYSTYLPGRSPGYELGPIVAMASHPTRGLAAIPLTGMGLHAAPAAVSDNEIYFYSAGFPSVMQGKFVIPDFVANSASYAAHGKWLFFDSAGVNLYAVSQADSAGGLTNDFAIHSISLTGSACSTTLARPSLTAPGAGALLSAAVNSTGNCPYLATTAASWIALPRPHGAGPTNLEFLVRPNRSGISRTGKITVGSETLTITQAAAPPGSLVFQPLSFHALQAEFSKSRDRLLLTAAYPHELHIIDPVTQADVTVSLPFLPHSLALSPDGNTAGVGGDGAVVFVNLSSGATTPAYRTQADVRALVLPGDGFAHLFSSTSELTAVEISTGSLRRTGQYPTGPARLQPPANRFVYAGEGKDITKWDVGTPGVAQLVRPIGTAETCGMFWLSEDGASLFARCSGVYGASETPAADLGATGGFSGLTVSGVAWAADSAQAKTIAVIPWGSLYRGSWFPNDMEIQLFGQEFLSYLGTAPLPWFESNAGERHPGRGRFVLWNAAADTLFVVMQADPAAGLTSDSAIYSLKADGQCASPVNGNPAAFTLGGGQGQVAVTASCAWRAISNSSWLTVTSGAFGVGSATLNYSVAANNTGSTRSGTISFGAASYTVTQSAGSLTLTPPALYFGAAGGTASMGISTSAASISWTATSLTPWIRITSPASGTGPGAISCTVSPNAGLTSRAGTIQVSGITATVTQGAAPSETVRLDPNYATIDPAGGTVSLAVTANGRWVAVSSDFWLRITTPAGGVGTGSGTLSISAGGNTTSAFRSATVTVNGQPIQVIQYEQPATYSLNPSSLSLSAAGEAGTVTVTPSKAVNSIWSAFSNATWLKVAGSANGNGRFTYTAAANLSAEARTAKIYVENQSMMVTQSGVTPPATQLAAGLHFVPVTPCRLADTREDKPGGFGKPALAGSVERIFAVPQGSCGIPSDAKAYSMNVTVVPKGPLSYLTIWSTGRPQPLVSTLNSLDGRVKANAALVPAGANGAVSVAATGATELVLDINGYFVEPILNPAALAFYPITPCRVADTRLPTGALGGPAIPGGGIRTFPVRSSRCGLPPEALAYSMNATVVPAEPLGYLTMWPAGQPQPFVSTLNALTGAIVANAAILPAGAGGAVSVFASGSTHLVLDVNGYFAPAGAADGQKFYVATPCRLLDTREATGGLGGPRLDAGQVRLYQLALSVCGLPAYARAFSLNATVVPETVLSYLTLWPAGSTQPVVSTLNALDDRIVANAAIVPAGLGGVISSFATNNTHLILDTNGYFAQ